MSGAKRRFTPPPFQGRYGPNLARNARNEKESHKWRAVNVGTFEKDFTRIVSPELAQNIVHRLRQGEIVEFPDRYELAEIKGTFGGCFAD
jgi:hypothetical protein